MDLQGKTVKVNFPENGKEFNNNQVTAPAIVVVDWSPEETKLNAKALNLQIITDGQGLRYEAKAFHNSISVQPIKNITWELYE